MKKYSYLFIGIMETRNRSTVLYSGELMELDINDYKEIQNLFVILLSDGLILSSILKSTSKSQKRYKFQSLFELDNIAVVNVKDPNFKTAFKILMFPSTKVFKAESIQIKNQWLDAFDAAKKQRRTSLSLQRRDSMMFIDGSQGTNVGAKTPISPIDRPYSGILNPFEETELMEDVSEIDTEMLPSWLIDVPEDLDVYVAQRNFEEAVKLVLKVNDHFALYPKCCDGIMQTDLKLRIDHRINELINAISNELKTAPDRSLQTGPRSARRAVILLHKLGKTSLATKLFLNQRSALLKFSLRQQKIEGATLQYIKRMSSVFFTNVKETTKEFQKAFDLNALTSNGSLISPPNSLISDNISINNEKLSPTSISVAPSMSCLMKWTHEQLVYLISLFSRHVFTTQVSTSVAAECVALIRHHCHKLKNIGIDLLYYLDKQLKTDVERLITECKEKLLEAIKLRSNDDKWQPQNYTNTIKITKFIEDMKENGILTIEKFIYDEVRVDLTANTISFAKSYLNTLKDLLKLSTYFSHDLIIEALVTTFKAQMKHIATALKQKHIPSEKKFIEKNATFLLDTILTLSQEFYYEKFGFNCEELSVMHANYAYLKGEIDSRRNSKSNSTPKKYTSTTYL